MDSVTQLLFGGVLGAAAVWPGLRRLSLLPPGSPVQRLGCEEARVCRHLPRRFHEEMLDCCHPLSKVREEGITLTQVCVVGGGGGDFARVAEPQPARTFQLGMFA